MEGRVRVGARGKRLPLDQAQSTPQTIGRRARRLIAHGSTVRGPSDARGSPRESGQGRWNGSS